MAAQSRRKRFGTMAFEQGYITLDQLIDAIKIQLLEDVATYSHRRIGMILLEEQMMSTPQVDHVLECLGRVQN